MLRATAKKLMPLHRFATSFHPNSEIFFSLPLIDCFLLFSLATARSRYTRKKKKKKNRIVRSNGHFTCAFPSPGVSRGMSSVKSGRREARDSDTLYFGLILLKADRISFAIPIRRDNASVRLFFWHTFRLAFGPSLRSYPYLGL